MPEEGEEKTCLKYNQAESNKITHSCQAAEVGASLPCKETPFCSYVTDSENEKDCTNYPLEITNGDTVCVPKEGDDFICQEKYLCDKVPKGTTEACSNFVLQEDLKYAHYCKSIESNDYACGFEKYECNTVPKIEGETEITCSTFLDPAKSSTHVCIKDETSITNQCKEMKLCSKVEADDMTGITDCSSSFYYDKENYACQLNEENNICKEVPLCTKATLNEDTTCSSFPTSDEDHVCIEDDTKCKEEFYCSKVPKSEESKEGFDCSKYTLSKENNDGEHTCVKDLVSTTYACKEEYLCTKAKTGANDEECAKYPVSNINRSTHGCVKDDEEGKVCKEQQLCNPVTLEEPDDGECLKYAVSYENIKTHICLKNTASEGSSCVETLSCEGVASVSSDEECLNYPVKNKNTHLCVKAKIGEKPCEEKMLCEEIIEGTSNEECRKYPVKKENQGNKACIKNPAKDQMGCIEEQYCEKVPKGENVDCSKYPVSEENLKTHICRAISEPTLTACEEIRKSEINCEEATQGETDEQCKGYKTAENKKCVKNTGTGTNLCKEEEISECERKTTGVTEEGDCTNLAVEKTGEQKCIKNPTGDNCMLLSYCNYAVPSSDGDCSKFALKDTEKECKKKEGENKCEEVEKKTEPEEPEKPDEENEEPEESEEHDETKESEEGDKTEKEKENDEGDDTSKATPSNTGNKGNENSGNLINVAFCLLLINLLLL